MGKIEVFFANILWQFYVQVVGEDVKILPKSAVSEKDRVPKVNVTSEHWLYLFNLTVKPVESVRLNFSSGNADPSPRGRGMYNTILGQANSQDMGQCGRRGWE